MDRGTDDDSRTVFSGPSWAAAQMNQDGCDDLHKIGQTKTPAEDRAHEVPRPS